VTVPAKIVGHSEFGTKLVRELTYQPDQSAMVVCAYGGLGARMVGLVCAHQIVKAQGLRLYVNWPMISNTNYHLRFEASLSDLWPLQDSGVTLISDKSYHSMREVHQSESYMRLLTQTGQVTPRLVWGLVHGAMSFGSEDLIQRDVYNPLSNEHYVQQNSFFREHYHIAPNLKQRLKRLVSQHGIRDRIGLQIRCRGSKLCTNWGAEERFREYIHGRIQQEPSATFFLSSDDPLVAWNFVNEFGENRIFHVEKCHAINTRAALRDTVIDAELLALCRESKSTAYTTLQFLVSMLRGERVGPPENLVDDIPKDPAILSRS